MTTEGVDSPLQIMVTQTNELGIPYKVGADISELEDALCTSLKFEWRSVFIL